MKIVLMDAFLTKTGDEHSDTQAMGGIASTMLYLADTLAERGHSVTLLANDAEKTRRSGVRVQRMVQFHRSVLDGAGAIIVNNNADNVTTLKPYADPGTPLILWQHNPPGVRFVDLGRSTHALDTEHRHSPDAIVFVSAWQRQAYLEAFELDPTRCHVVRNACSPFFTQPDSDATDALFATKREAFEIAYCSAPERGLLSMLSIWPRLWQEFPEAKLAIYSGRRMYDINDPDDGYNQLLSSPINLPAVEYRGALCHRDLAERLRRTAVLAYPAQVEETSCISVLEGLASGCSVVCSALGALPESTAGHAELVPYSSNRAAFEEAFLAACRSVLQTWRADGPTLFEPLARQRRTFREAYTWGNRALEWEALIHFLRHRLWPRSAIA